MNMSDEPARSAAANLEASAESTWVVIGTAAELVKRRKTVVEIDGRQILVLAHDGQFFAFDNICRHQQRELSKGVILNGKIVCPGHQWAFALDTGWEAIKQVCQPTHALRVTGDLVEVCVAPVSAPSVPTPKASDGSAADQQSVKAWVDGWGAEVAAVDLAAARVRFADDVSAFGTHADVVVGRDSLEAEQWAQVWPAIEDFYFLTDEMQVLVSPDRLQAVAVVGWTSTGIDQAGNRFDRPGRATLVLHRQSIDGLWLGSHTHFSLGRGVPQSTHGARPVVR
ncbi:MAG: Rieske 2Fe-2S domain-containing protein [Ilumatobacteraceae bacterium]